MLQPLAFTLNAPIHLHDVTNQSGSTRRIARQSASVSTTATNSMATTFKYPHPLKAAYHYVLSHQLNPAGISEPSSPDQCGLGALPSGPPPTHHPATLIGPASGVRPAPSPRLLCREETSAPQLESPADAKYQEAQDSVFAREAKVTSRVLFMLLC